ncbi:unnamed protein product [Ambrosiozyma monospora]|uniref:Unnamed protein product n=1 Tax=Ambrosiozyma monospora TaxID=43982 RepID=A0ACB5T667_AMBMO|nr:unnamed protein product [Ambrosiozyma monospora]
MRTIRSNSSLKPQSATGSDSSIARSNSVNNLRRMKSSSSISLNSTRSPSLVSRYSYSGINTNRSSTANPSSISNKTSSSTSKVQPISGITKSNSLYSRQSSRPGSPIGQSTRYSADSRLSPSSSRAPSSARERANLKVASSSNSALKVTETTSPSSSSFGSRIHRLSPTNRYASQKARSGSPVTSPTATKHSTTTTLTSRRMSRAAAKANEKEQLQKVQSGDVIHAGYYDPVDDLDSVLIGMTQDLKVLQHALVEQTNEQKECSKHGDASDGLCNDHNCGQNSIRSISPARKALMEQLGHELQKTMKLLPGGAYENSVVDNLSEMLLKKLSLSGNAITGTTNAGSSELRLSENASSPIREADEENVGKNLTNKLAAVAASTNIGKDYLVELDDSKDSTNEVKSADKTVAEDLKEGDDSADHPDTLEDHEGNNSQHTSTPINESKDLKVIDEIINENSSSVNSSPSSDSVGSPNFFSNTTNPISNTPTKTHSLNSVDKLSVEYPDGAVAASDRCTAIDNVIAKLGLEEETKYVKKKKSIRSFHSNNSTGP